MRNAKETIDYIMQLARERDISQRELAKKVDIPESTLSRYVNYSREFPINDIGAYAKALGVHVYDLLDLEPDQGEGLSFPQLSRLVRTIQSAGALNLETLENKRFQERLCEAMIEDLRKQAAK